MEFFSWLEQLGYSTFVRESNSLWAFPMFLFVHTLGMSLVAGGSTIINLALLGLWPKAPIKPLARLFPVLLWGFAINAFTGVSLFMADASTRGVNPDFYVKLVFVALGLFLLFKIRKTIFGDPALDEKPLPANAKILAWASLTCWFGAIITGRLIAYVGPVAGL